MSHFQTKKSLGQHFLNDTNIAGKIADAGEIDKGERVLEIGPGTGILTEALLERGAVVVAVEADLRAVDVLKERFSEAISSGDLTIHHADIRERGFEYLGLKTGNFKIIDNIPYYISGLLFRIALSGGIKPSMVVFLVQKEVAERIAREKKESLLSVSVKAYGDPEYVFTVKRGSFTPPPKVDSAVLRIRNVHGNRLAKVGDEHFFEVAKRGFGSRRKQLFGTLKDHYEKTLLTDAFVHAKIGEKDRGEDLTIEQWILLAEALYLSTRTVEK